MTYEYGTGQQGLNYPNPYKVENYVLSIRIVIFAVAFMILLWLAKVDLDSGNHLGMAINLIGLIGFLLGAISSSYKLSRQIRVYFGRGQPSGLAQELKPGMDGVTASGQHIKEAIRQGALVVDTPPGNINGFLYSHRRDLIIAPKEVQFLTQHVFSNMIKMGVLLGLFALSSFFAMGNHAGGWLGLYFFLVTLFVVVEPLLQTNQTSISLNMNVFWSLFALSIIVPVGLIMEGRHLPDMSSYSFGAQSFLIILLTLAGELLCFHALKFQLESPTGITTAFAQDSVSFNAPPAQINLEIERELQKEWTAAIPNRSYLRQTPQINMGTNGHFSGQIIPHYRYRSREKVQAWLEKMGVKHYSIEEDLTVNVAGDVKLCRKKLFFLPVVFGRVEGVFNISDNFLKTLAGCPREVTGEFYCDFNKKLKTLKGGPELVGASYYCYSSALVSLEGIPEIIHGVLNCSNNNITSLKYAPKWIERIFICSVNPITDFNAYQFSCGEEFHCTHTRKNRIEALSDYYVEDDLIVPGSVLRCVSLHETLHSNLSSKPAASRKAKI